MKLTKTQTGSLISIALAVAVATVFSLSSFAAPEVTGSAVDPLLAQDCTGTLTIKSGSVTINGNAAQTGATIMSGNIIATSSGGVAIIDLGALGRVEVGNNTAATIICAGNTVTVRTNCDRTELKVTRGQVMVGTEPVTAGQEKDFDDPFEAIATGGADFSVECEGQKVGAYIWPGLGGVLALIGLGAAVAAGIAIGDEDQPGGVVSPSVP